jgi:hypothetical protein
MKTLAWRLACTAAKISGTLGAPLTTARWYFEGDPP